MWEDFVSRLVEHHLQDIFSSGKVKTFFRAGSNRGFFRDPIFAWLADFGGREEQEIAGIFLGIKMPAEISDSRGIFLKTDAGISTDDQPVGKD